MATSHAACFSKLSLGFCPPTDPSAHSLSPALQDLAQHYHKATFVTIEIDRSPEAKELFKHVLLGRYVPAFYFFRSGKLLHSHADASAAVLEKHLREHLPATEQPVQPVLQLPDNKPHQQQQQHHPAGGAPRGYSLADLVYDSL